MREDEVLKSVYAWLCNDLRIYQHVERDHLDRRVLVTELKLAHPVDGYVKTIDSTRVFVESLFSEG